MGLGECINRRDLALRADYKITLILYEQCRTDLFVHRREAFFSSDLHAGISQLYNQIEGKKPRNQKIAAVQA